MMDELMEILEELRPDVDFANETKLITDGILDSFDIVALVGELNDAFDIEIKPSQMDTRFFLAKYDIEAGKTAEDVLNGTARVLTKSGKDCTDDILFGAQAALGMAKRNNARVALLKQNSPSCGTKNVYDGSFSGQLTAGMGVLTALLKKEGILVFDETEIDALENALNN